MNSNYRLTFKKAWLHFKTICVHKKWVFHYAKMCGITWQGLIHDMSKFSPSEFFTNARYFEPGVSPIDIQKKVIGFSFPWQHHKGHNPHHYEFWMDKFEDGCYVTCIPCDYMIEMLCDFLAANKAYNKENATFKSEYEWWTSQKRIKKMHPCNTEFIDRVLKSLKYAEEHDDEDAIYNILSSSHLRTLYWVCEQNNTYPKQVRIDKIN